MIINILGGILGVILYTLLTATITYTGQGFNLKEMINSNGLVWLRSILTVIVLTLIFTLYPESVVFFTDKLGLEIGEGTTVLYPVFGFMVTPLIKAFVNRNKVTE